MFKIFFCVVIQLLCFNTLFAKSCPKPLDPLPKLPVPAVVPPPTSECSTPKPETLKGYLPITFVNKSGLSAEDIYICVLVNSSTQYLSFIGSDGHKLAKITKFEPSTYISEPRYTKKLSEFEKIEEDTYTFYIPNDGNNGIPTSNFMTSSRILISLKEPLTYFVNNFGVLQFPTEYDAKNDNYYILNDKIEFDLGSNALNRLNLNLTWVDFFGLPVLIQANYKFLFGKKYSQYCAVTGMPKDVGLFEVFSKYEQALESLDPPFDDHWRGLVATYKNPDNKESKLRIFAPATAMGSTQTQSNPSKVFFPTDYFLRSISDPDECTWFNAVWNGRTKTQKQAFYERRKPTPYLILDATTASTGAATAKGYQVSSGDFAFQIEGGKDKGTNVIFPWPTSSKAFFTGAVSDYEPAITGNSSIDTKNQLLKVFATSIISGFTPINCKVKDPFTITNTYVQNRSSDYFENNHLLQEWLRNCDCVNNVPWYDFYSRTLLTIGSPNLFYTSAYSDFLGTDGTIVIVNLEKDNKDASITVNLNDFSTGINFPDPYSDTKKYNITIGLPKDVVVKFGKSKDGPFGTIPSTASGDAFFLQVTYKDGYYKGKTFVTQIAPSVQVFHPVLPGEGVITTNGSSCVVNIGAGPKKT